MSLSVVSNEMSDAVQPRDERDGPVVTTARKVHSLATMRTAAYTLLVGAITMIIGAAFWGASGTDLWLALNTNDMAGYLAATGAVKTILVTNLTLWIVGVLILGVAGTLLADISGPRQITTQIALVCFRTSVPLVMVSYLAMLALVVQIAPDASAVAVSIAEVIGWIGARADDLATALIAGLGPFFISLAGQGDWAPRWLVGWGYLTGLVGLFSIVVLYFPALASLGFAIIPVGLGWMIATGIVLLRQSRAQF